MRRSVAPSQLNSACKRPRFSTPFSNKQETLKPNADKRSTTELLQLIQGNVEEPENDENNFTKQLSCNNESALKVPTESAKVVSNSTTTAQQTSINRLPIQNDVSMQEPQEQDGNRYFSVVWCKLSKKKHKNWEGDAILIVKGRTATLKDMEGKQIGQGSGYKIKDLENLDDGSTLVVGGKEIEIMNAIKQSEFTSGSCFMNNSEPIPVPALNKNRPKNNLVIIKKPLYDASSPNALVLTPPNQNHQWLNNTKKLPLTDVVVDPHLTLHMRAHQKEGVLFLYECIMGMRGYNGSGAILADEMGLGKTLQCIALVWTLLKQGPYGGQPILKRILIVTPSSLVQNWVKEFNKWLGKGRIFIYAVDTKHSAKDFSKTPCCPVMIISYEMLMRSCDVVETMNFDLIVCDEGHRLKNTSVKTTSSITRLPIKKRILLTGTPVQNDLQEFFALVEFCNPGILGSSSSFHRIYEGPINLSRQPNASQEDREIGENRAAELMRLTALFTLRRTQDVINKFLPPKVENVIFCKATALQASLIKVVLNSTLMRNCLQSSEHTSHPFICISALKKICNHPSLFFKKNEKQMSKEGPKHKEDLYNELSSHFPARLQNDTFNEELSGKMNVLDRILSHSHQNNCNERFVLVSCYTKTLDLFQQLCHKNNYLYLRLDGSTPTNQRQGIVDSFNQTTSYFVFLLSSKAGGVGFNLIGASRIILFDIDWNPANDLQAMARVWRDGQKKTVHIYRFLTTGTIEEKIFQRQVSKQNLSDAVMEQVNTSKIEFSTEELRDLFTFHENTNSITHDRLDCTCVEGTLLNQDDNLDSAERSCQLRPNKPRKLNSNLNMNQLLQWHHFVHPICHSQIDDKHLESASDHISFVFQTKTNENRPLT